jgi:hypothetical protein
MSSFEGVFIWGCFKIGSCFGGVPSFFFFFFFLPDLGGDGG